MIPGRLIVFAGTVGAGKSTHLRLLHQHLVKRGVNTKKACLKTGNLMGYAFLKILSSMLVVKKSDVPLITVINESYPTLFRACGFLFTLIDALSLVVKDLISIKLPLMLGRFVLVEEYLPATVLDYLILFRVRKVISRKSFNIIYKLCASLSASCTQGQNVTFFFDASNDVLFKRYRSRGSFMEKRLYLDMQRRLLPHLYSRLLGGQIVFIDTSSNSIPDVQQLLREIVL